MTLIVPSTQLAFTDSCQIDGPIQKLKALVQGRRYWANQLALLDAEIQRLESQPDTIKRMQAIVDEQVRDVLKRSRQSMEELYSRYPDLRPSRSQIQADELRNRADAIEHAEMLKTLERLNAHRLTELKSCRPILLAAVS